MSTVCLVMVVRDEAAVMRRCLESVRSIIGHWIICDTGSTDGTQGIIQEYLQGIPGALYEIPVADSGQNRTKALDLARGKADYFLVMDADATLSVSGGLPNELEADSYLIREEGAAECWVERLLSAKHQWRYVGIVRPFAHSPTSRTRRKLDGVTQIRHEDPARRQARYREEIELLKESLERGYNVQRTTFHLAQCYRDLGNVPLAIEYYEKRATMGGWAEEVWYSLYQVARLQHRLGIAWVLVLNQYLRAYEYRPNRIEPLFHLARSYRENGQYRLARLFAQAGVGAGYPDDLLFIEREVYEGGLAAEYALCCEQLGDNEPRMNANGREFLAVNF